MDNRKLLIALGVLVAVFLAGKIFRGNRTSSFDPVLAAVDTAKVDRILFRSGGEEKEEFELTRTDEGWEARKGEMKAQVPGTSSQSILGPLAGLNAERLVTGDGERHEEFELSDEQATRITVFQQGKEVADLMLGGFKFDQVARTASMYIRKADKPDVFLIDGFRTMGLKSRFDQFRDKKLVNVQAEDLTSIQWMDLTGRKEVIQREEGVWHYAGMEAVDSTAVQSYLTSLVNGQGTAFSDVTSAQGLSLAEKVTLYGNNMVDPIVISAYAVQDTLSPFLIHSTANPDAFFKSDSSGLFKRIFADLRPFWPNGQ